MTGIWLGSSPWNSFLQKGAAEGKEKRALDFPPEFATRAFFNVSAALALMI